MVVKIVEFLWLHCAANQAPWLLSEQEDLCHRFISAERLGNFQQPHKHVVNGYARTTRLPVITDT